jgi:hypothetical protein
VRNVGLLKSARIKAAEKAKVWSALTFVTSNLSY